MRRKSIASKFLALVLMFALLVAISVPAFATYIGLNINPPPSNDWTIATYYHWVVRGETLASIAQYHGTTVAQIIQNNPVYFADLALRNTTRGQNVVVENGIRLRIYEVVTCKHYVVRGDTLGSLASGALMWNGWQLWTTPQAIRNQNANWFRNLEAVGVTFGVNVELLESNAIVNAGGFNPQYDHFDGAFSDVGDAWGQALYISVPVIAAYAGPGPIPGVDRYHYYTATYLANNSETTPGPNGFQQNVNDNTYPSNPNIPILPPGIDWTAQIFPDDYFIIQQRLTWTKF